MSSADEQRARELMSIEDPICRICGEPKSKHLPTAKGPFTHPREATGEGIYLSLIHI